ncbi:hypothetical protein [Mycobacterium tilburgii]|uniref:hypothetical protein n=1 Tax=Mycobacterium tilburgii TaxID=44467 RepID=UPI0011834447|nr:hypothetical protein [Mycobacterium tilburgii]
MKFTVSIFEKRGENTQQRWSHLFGGRVRTSTLILIVAFLSMWWVYDTYRPEPVKPPQVVPPGFVPDPNYTLVPRTRVEAPRPTTPTFVPMPTTTVPPSPTTTLPPTPPSTSTSPPPFQLPCLLPPPFCAPSSSPTPPPPQQPVPGPGPTATTPPPAS